MCKKVVFLWCHVGTFDLIQKYQIFHPGDPRIQWFYASGAKNPPSALTPYYWILELHLFIIRFSVQFRSQKGISNLLPASAAFSHLLIS